VGWSKILLRRATAGRVPEEVRCGGAGSTWAGVHGCLHGPRARATADHDLFTIRVHRRVRKIWLPCNVFQSNDLSMRMAEQRLVEAGTIALCFTVSGRLCRLQAEAIFAESAALSVALGACR